MRLISHFDLFHTKKRGVNEHHTFQHNKTSWIVGLNFMQIVFVRLKLDQIFSYHEIISFLFKTHPELSLYILIDTVP
jgi:hypothetical protein